jgi:hypothetical protein
MLRIGVLQERFIRIDIARFTVHANQFTLLRYHTTSRYLSSTKQYIHHYRTVRQLSGKRRRGSEGKNQELGMI